MNHASGTWTLTKEHERKKQSTQRKNASTHHTNEKEIQKIGKQKDETDLGCTEDENGDGQSPNTHKDQDSDISFENDTDDEIDTTAIEKEEWIEDIRRSRDEAIEKMENVKIRCWIKAHKRLHLYQMRDG